MHAHLGKHDGLTVRGANFFVFPTHQNLKIIDSRSH